LLGNSVQANHCHWNHRELALPVLFVDGDDDRNVPFRQTTDLVEKLRAQSFAFEELVIPTKFTTCSAGAIGSAPTKQQQSFSTADWLRQANSNKPVARISQSGDLNRFSKLLRHSSLFVVESERVG
jgi:hypothetical protein